MFMMFTLLQFHFRVCYCYRGDLYLLHRDTEEMLSGSADQTIHVEKCTSPKLTKVTGRKLCWMATYQNATGSEAHPHFPLTGPVKADLVLSPVDL